MHWIEEYEPGGAVRCSACGRPAPFDSESAEYIKPRKCPFCGASTDDATQGRLFDGGEQ